MLTGDAAAERAARLGKPMSPSQAHWEWRWWAWESATGLERAPLGRDLGAWRCSRQGDVAGEAGVVGVSCAAHGDGEGGSVADQEAETADQLGDGGTPPDRILARCISQTQCRHSTPVAGSQPSGARGPDWPMLELGGRTGFSGGLRHFA